MTDAEMSLILTVFWTHSISELKRAPVKASLSLVWGGDGDWEKRVVLAMR